MSMYSRVRASGLAQRTPCQPSDTCGPDRPRPRRNRPPDSVSRVAAVIAVIAGVRAGICITALPMSMRGACAAEAYGSYARTVGLGRPYHRVAQPVGLPGQGQVVRVVAHAPVAEVQSQLHALTLEVTPWAG